MHSQESMEIGMDRNREPVEHGKRARWEHVEVFISFDDDPHGASYLIHYGLDGRARSYRWERHRSRRANEGQWGFAIQTPYETWLEGKSRQAIWQRMRDVIALLGAEGWEAVSMATDSDEDQPGLRYLFRRRAQSQPSGPATEPNDATTESY
jgi:hypothetical protein